MAVVALLQFVDNVRDLFHNRQSPFVLFLIGV
jgi:hypothetical protein